MKNFKVFLTAVLLILSTSTFAQSMSNTWSAYVQWNPSSFSGDHGLSLDFDGLSAGVNKAFPLSSKVPLYLEAGVGLQYSFYSDTAYEEDVKVNMLSAKIPVSLGYEFQIPNSSISISPYAGIDVRGNIYGRIKYEEFGESESYDLFSDDDMDGDAWNRVQLGWHVGVNAKFFKKLLVGVSYGTDFNEISEGVKIHTTSVTLGVCF